MKTTQAQPEIDITIQNEGSIFLFWPHTRAAQEWLDEHTPRNDDHQYIGYALVVEHRYASSIAGSMTRDGLVVK